MGARFIKYPSIQILLRPSIRCVCSLYLQVAVDHHCRKLHLCSSWSTELDCTVFVAHPPQNLNFCWVKLFSFCFFLMLVSFLCSVSCSISLHDFALMSKYGYSGSKRNHSGQTAITEALLMVYINLCLQQSEKNKHK